MTGIRDVVTILIVHNNVLFRQCLSKSIEEYQHLFVVNQVSTTEFLDLDNYPKSDILLIDTSSYLGKKEDIINIMNLYYYESKCVLLGEVCFNSYALISDNNICGLLSESQSLETIIQEIYIIFQGNYICDLNIKKSIDKTKKENEYLLKRILLLLSHREREVFELIINGYSNSEISDHLNITIKTVEAHITRIFRKLDIKNRDEIPHLG